ncbi:MAG: TetR/AcrR family transcriptional regulator [bacterium]
MERKSTEVRKNEIIHAAWGLMREDGAQNVTIKKISQEIATSEAAIYRHFKDKHSILMALVDSFEENLMEAIDKPMRNYKSPIDQLREIMKTHMVFTEKKQGLLFAITAESIHFGDDELRRRILEVIEKYKKRIKQILQEAKKAELLDVNINLDAVSLTFFGLIDAAIVQYALTNYTVPPIKRFDTLWRIFYRGIKR